MIQELKIKVLAIGCETMLNRLSARLDEDAFSLRTCSSHEGVRDLLQQEPFDVVIIDDLFNDTAQLCRDASRAGPAPVAVLCRCSLTDWRKFGRLEVDGFFPDEAGAGELMARVKAFSRRKLLSPQPARTTG